MAAGPTNPTEYIQGHLSHLAKPIGEAGGFWTLHVDSVVMAVLIGVASSGAHSNGYSLIRRILAEGCADLHAPAPFDSARSLADARTGGTR